MVCSSKYEAELVFPHLQFSARASYSNPPKYGAQLVDIILSDPNLTNEWKKELSIMQNRLKTVRQNLVKLLNCSTNYNWDFINKQIGMFAYTCLSPEECDRLKKIHHIYITKDGRLNLSGLTLRNIEYVAQSIEQSLIRDPVDRQLRC